jgi:hypothetical protein
MVADDSPFCSAIIKNDGLQAALDIQLTTQVKKKLIGQGVPLSYQVRVSLQVFKARGYIIQMVRFLVN